MKQTVQALPFTKNPKTATSLIQKAFTNRRTHPAASLYTPA
jgi:hypothetical protein